MSLSARDTPEQFVLPLVIVFNPKPVSEPRSHSCKQSFDFDSNMCYSETFIVLIVFRSNETELTVKGNLRSKKS